MRKISKYWIAVIAVFLVTIVLNLIAFSKSFCDLYSVTVYRGLNAVVGFLTGWSRVAIGEIIMYVGALLIVLLVVFAIVGVILFKNKAYRKFLANYAKACLAILLVFLLVFTTNWAIPFRGNVLKVKNSSRTEFAAEEVISVRNQIAEELNETAKLVPRDENGRLITEFSQEEIFEVLRSRSDEFPKLKGHYSKAKAALCSDELEWMGIGGFNYIYTMEPTYNKYVSSISLPVTIAHELCHHKGYYLENEATFLSAVALAESDDPFLKYCGLIEMYNYIDFEAMEAYSDARINDPSLVTDFKALCEEGMIEGPFDENDMTLMAMVLYNYDENIVQVDDVVIDDVLMSLDESNEQYLEEVNETMEETTSEVFTEVSLSGWEIQGDILKENTYSGMTLMILQYYLE